MGTPLILHKKVSLLVMGSTTWSPLALELHFKVRNYNPDDDDDESWVILARLGTSHIRQKSYKLSDWSLKDERNQQAEMI